MLDYIPCWTLLLLDCIACWTSWTDMHVGLYCKFYSIAYWKILHSGEYCLLDSIECWIIACWRVLHVGNGEYCMLDILDSVACY